MDNIFLELTLVLIGAGVIAYVIHFFKQPSIIAYILTGLLIGPIGIYHLHHGEILHSLSEIGITLLLFMVGLELNISQLKRIGKAAVYAGVGQVIFTCLIGFGIAKLLGIETIPALYIAIALTFSSTIIVVKLLTEKKDMQSLYGKLAIGIFLVQDLAAILILIILAGVSSDQGSIIQASGTVNNIIITLTKVFMIGFVVVALSRTVFPKLMKSLMRSDELLLLFSLGWSLGLAALFTSPLIGFNAAIGGFVAGLALANTGANYQISGKIKSLRDFFIIIFFIVLGSQLVVTSIAAAIIPAAVLTVFVLIGNPLIVTFILGSLGYKLRTSFMTGVTVAQISEFSLILMTLGLAAGHVNETHATIVTLVGISTIAISSYGILHSNKIYEAVLGKVAHLFDRRRKHDTEDLGEVVLKNHIVIIGAHRLGSHIVEGLRKHKEQFIIIDFNPDIVTHYKNIDLLAVCGDISDPYIQEVASLAVSQLVISTIPDLHDTLALIEAVRSCKRRIKLIVAASDEPEAIELYKRGADYVLLPHFIGGMHLADIIKTHVDKQSLKTLKEKHLKALQKLVALS